MRVFCSGFNLYGQFIKHTNLIVEGFIDCHYDDVTGIELSQTFSVLCKRNDVFLIGMKNGKSHQMEKIVFPSELNITQTSCTDKRILFLTSNGLLFKLDLNNRTMLMPTQLPNIILNEDEHKKDLITKISCNSKINIALSQQGKLFNLPNKLCFENNNIIEICTGREHCVILDGDGNVYSFGRGSRGQLGHGNLEDEVEPKLIEALAGLKISKIAAGGWHSCAIGSDGDVYSWGWNGNGQLGIGNGDEETISIMAIPHIIDFENINTQESLDFVVVNVACGNRHTVALLDNGKLFGAGWNKYRQLGNPNGTNEDFYTFTLLYNFHNLNVADLKCGPWSTAVIVN